MNGRDEFNRDMDEARWAVGMIFLKFGIPLIVLVLILGGLGWVFGIFGQGAKIIEKTMDADNVIQNYEWFEQTYDDFKATNKKIETAKQTIQRFEESAGPRKEWTFEDKTEHSRLQSILMGLENYCADIVSKYNARSRMINRKLFKSKGLPEKLE